MTRRYLSFAGSSAGQVSDVGNAADGAASLSSSAVINPSFHVLRCNCHVPSTTSTANASTVGTSNPFHDRRRFLSVNRASGGALKASFRRSVPLPRGDDIAALSTELSSAAADRA